MDVVLASSPVEAGVECWDLRTGAEQLRYRNCASAPHGLVSVAGRFIAASQLRDSPSSSGAILYWSWDKVSFGSWCVESYSARLVDPKNTRSGAVLRLFSWFATYFKVCEFSFGKSYDGDRPNRLHKWPLMGSAFANDFPGWTWRSIFHSAFFPLARLVRTLDMWKVVISFLLCMGAQGAHYV